MNESNISNRMPDAFVILFFVVLLAAAMTYVIPAGSFKTTEVVSTVNGELTTRTVIAPGSFKLATDEVDNGAPVFSAGNEPGFLNYAFEGLVSGNRMGSAVGVVAFILIVGGAFGIIMHSGAVNNGIMALIRKVKKADKVILPLMFFLFSLGGAIFGMGEEAIAFCIVLTPLVIALGYDAITAVLITYVATQIGFATSWMNPFSIAIAQGIADIPLLSGSEFRIAAWAVFTLVGVVFTMRYGASIKAHPEKSLSYHSDFYFRRQQSGSVDAEFNRVDGLILLTLLGGIIWVIWGVIVHEYYIPQIATQFFAMGIAVGIICVVSGRMRMNTVSDSFQQGAKDLLPAALIVGMAKGIVLLLGGDDATTPSVLNTILYYAGEAMSGIPDTGSAVFMYMFQSIFNFFLASGSGQAALTMPIMAPLADLVGVTRQVAVLAFQLGDGLTNIIIPTSASLIGCLGVARIDWSTWAKFAWRLFLLLFAMSVCTMVIAVAIGYQ
ncbi:MAG: putative basic amino acid antiporter YfcC [Aestuariibacter sp.]